MEKRARNTKDPNPQSSSQLKNINGSQSPPPMGIGDPQRGIRYFFFYFNKNSKFKFYQHKFKYFIKHKNIHRMHKNYKQCFYPNLNSYMEDQGKICHSNI